jgi:hypothetical protein
LAAAVKGGTQIFTAAVTGDNKPAQTVTWSIAESVVSGTVISADGVLTIAAGETAAALTVKAASTLDTGKSGTAAVTVISGPAVGDNTTIDDPAVGNY